MMAKVVGSEPAPVQRICALHGLAPHRVKSSKFHRPAFVDKLHDIVGLYVDPHAHAVVLRSMKRAKIPGRSTAPSPFAEKKGAPERLTHDYRRTDHHAVAALTSSTARHVANAAPRNQELFDSSTQFEARGRRKDGPAIVDNYAHP